ncbi:isochorismatase [Oscillatoria sp. FACHB-1407]|uniref:isochorismatase n=1 Tax=Oscillatoria sp. FACHB-1407 TaxID=2692847 RepID=UPI0016858BB7|nr:isochorismatase [Oscillatoria sp. FACHB-1407]MBD2461599.1 isochorismatase [Oscillatoria sp. FACHB-1407]
MSTITQLPIPTHFDPYKVGEVWRVPYQTRAIEAKAWANQQGLTPATDDRFRVCLLAIDVQNTFCIPGFELFVGGRSGTGAVDDNVRLCEFIYRNLGKITTIVATMDTHSAMQIFHSVFWVNQAGEHPPAMTMISLEDVEQGVWQANPAIAPDVTQGNVERLQAYALHYVRQLNQHGKYLLTVWPYHSMLGGIGHALVSSVEEACFFHAIARQSQTQFEIKGGNPLTENYSVLKPEVLIDHEEQAIAQSNTPLLERLLTYDAVIIAGQAKSHCVAWTIDDLLTGIQATDPVLAQKIYLLEDCTSPVVVPDVVDFTEQADAAFQRFVDAGMKVVRSTDPIEQWAGMRF